MQQARFKLHAEERTCNPVQRPNFRGGGAKGDPRKLSQPPEGESVTTPREPLRLQHFYPNYPYGILRGRDTRELRREGVFRV